MKSRFVAGLVVGLLVINVAVYGKVMALGSTQTAKQGETSYE
jgi:hypothetical protein